MYTFTYLESWYSQKCNKTSHKTRRKHLVVIFPEFESIQENVIQDFILIARYFPVIINYYSRYLLQYEILGWGKRNPLCFQFIISIK